MAYLDALILACEAAKVARPVREFIMKTPDDLKSIRSAIYIISELEGDIEKTFFEFKKYKKTGKRACAKLNQPSRILYVGSSSTGVMNRVRQHLGTSEKYKSTYSLQLGHWAGERKFQIHISEYNVERDVLQLIEDSKSYDLKPAFGKMGGNNK